jgi:hypothetical protein
MQTSFEELNLYAYNALRNVAYDLLIWCLAPLIDDSREYSLARLYIAALACGICRRWMRLEP